MHRFRILVPVSFGSQSNVALRHARILAQKLKGMITCLHVIETQGFISAKFQTREMERKIRHEAEVSLASEVNAILGGNKDVLYELIITSGKVHRKILEKSVALDIDMIIMGRSDSTELSEHTIGTNASRVIERSTIPVLTMGQSEIPSYKHILAPLDLSSPVSLQLAKTIEIAELLRAKVTICAILPPGWPRLETAYRKRLLEIKKLSIHYELNCQVKLFITDKKIVDEIISCSKKYHPDLLLLMTQVESNLEELSIGSVAYQLICTSEIPILSVTPVLQKELYPYKSLFGSINNPINWSDHYDHVTAIE